MERKPEEGPAEEGPAGGDSAEENPSGGVAELAEGDLIAYPEGSEEPEGPDDGGPLRTGAGVETGASTDTEVNRLETFDGPILDPTGNIPGRPVPPHRSLADAMVHYYGDYVGVARRLHMAHKRGKIDNENFERACRALQKWFLDNLRAIRTINDGPSEMPSRVLKADEKSYITEMCARAGRPWTKQSTMDSLREHYLTVVQYAIS